MWFAYQFKEFLRSAQFTEFEKIMQLMNTFYMWKFDRAEKEAASYIQRQSDCVFDNEYSSSVIRGTDRRL